MTKSGRPNYMTIARPAAADERDHRVRHSLSKLSRDGQPGIELSARAAAGEHNVRWAWHVESEGEIGRGGEGEKGSERVAKRPARTPCLPISHSPRLPLFLPCSAETPEQR